MLYYRNMENHTDRALIIVMIVILIIIAIVIFLPHEPYFSVPVVEQTQPAIIQNTLPVQSHVYTIDSASPSSSSSSSYQQNTTTTTTTQQ
jgi:competence protein ComGC